MKAASGLGFEPGNFVRHPAKPEWGLGQVQSVIDDKVTVNFENSGKVTIILSRVSLVPEFAKPASRTPQ